VEVGDPSSIDLAKLPQRFILSTSPLLPTQASFIFCLQGYPPTALGIRIVSSSTQTSSLTKKSNIEADNGTERPLLSANSLNTETPGVCPVVKG
jgi:hypothetical protein